MSEFNNLVTGLNYDFLQHNPRSHYVTMEKCIPFLQRMDSTIDSVKHVPESIRDIYSSYMHTLCHQRHGTPKSCEQLLKLYQKYFGKAMYHNSIETFNEVFKRQLFVSINPRLDYISTQVQDMKAIMTMTTLSIPTIGDELKTKLLAYAGNKAVILSKFNKASHFVHNAILKCEDFLNEHTLVEPLNNVNRKLVY